VSKTDFHFTVNSIVITKSQNGTTLFISNFKQHEVMTSDTKPYSNTKGIEKILTERKSLFIRASASHFTAVLQQYWQVFLDNCFQQQVLKKPMTRTEKSTASP
jgi:hypothetical protein